MALAALFCLPTKKEKLLGAKKTVSDCKLKTRHIDTAGKRTTIALEKAFWRQADSQAEKVGQPWQQWAARMLEDRPGNIGKARWLRVRLLGTISGQYRDSHPTAAGSGT